MQAVAIKRKFSKFIWFILIPVSLLIFGNFGPFLDESLDMGTNPECVSHDCEFAVSGITKDFLQILIGFAIFSGYFFAIFLFFFFRKYRPDIKNYHLIIPFSYLSISWILLVVSNYFSTPLSLGPNISNYFG